MAVILPSIYYSPGLDKLIAIPAKREMNMKTLRYIGKGVILTDKYDRGACVFAVLTEMEAQYASHDSYGNYTQYRLVYSLVECVPLEEDPIVICHSGDLKEICRMYALQRMTNMWRKELLPLDQSASRISTSSRRKFMKMRCGHRSKLRMKKPCRNF